MKLLFCPLCEDLVRLLHTDRRCRCGQSWGHYTGHTTAQIGGRAIPIGITNKSLLKSIRNRKLMERTEIDAFVIPYVCSTIKKEE